MFLLLFRSELRIVLCQIISPSLFSPYSCWTGGRLKNRSQKCANHKTFWCLLPLCFTTWMGLLYTCGRNAYRRRKKGNDIFQHTHFIWVALQITPKERPHRRKSLNFWTLPKLPPPARNLGNCFNLLQCRYVVFKKNIWIKLISRRDPLMAIVLHCFHFFYEPSP